MPFTLDNQDKAQKFRKKRLKNVCKAKIWNPMSEGPYLVLHWLPISNKPLFDFDDLTPTNFSKFFPMESKKAELPNLDGIRFYSGMGDRTAESTNNFHNQTRKHKTRHFWNAQVFYSGALEIAFALHFQEDESGEKKYIEPDYIVNHLQNAMDQFKKCMESFKICNPIIVGVSLLRVMDYRFLTVNIGGGNSHAHSDRKKIILPGKRIEKAQDIGNIEFPIFNMLWRSFGLLDCPYYNEDGTRKNLNG